MGENETDHLLSFRQYAKLRGCSPQSVSNAVAEGRISVVKAERRGKPVDLIDPLKANIEWEHNTKTEYRNTDAEEKFSLVVESPKIDFGDGKPPSLFESRAWGEAYKAKIAQVEYEKAIGVLVPTVIVEQIWGKLLSNFRAKMIAIPSKVAPQLQGMEDILEIEQLIKEQIHEGLSELSEFNLEDYVK